MKHVVMFSGGAGSWATALRVREQNKDSDIDLLFADTLMEDEDLYRFLEEAASNVNGNLIKLTEGRDPWQVFHDKKYLGNSRIDPCSRVLKREFLRKYLDENYTVEDTIVYIGIDWTEIHRYEKAIPYWSPWELRAPLCEKPLVTKSEILSQLRDVGIEPPRLYKLGFPHNNCGGFCIKAGMAHFKLLLETMPERYKYHEEKEEELRKYLNKDVSIIRRRIKGDWRRHESVTLRQLREELQSGEDCDKDDWGGCGCFVD